MHRIESQSYFHICLSQDEWGVDNFTWCWQLKSRKFCQAHSVWVILGTKDQQWLVIRSHPSMARFLWSNFTFQFHLFLYIRQDQELSNFSIKQLPLLPPQSKFLSHLDSCWAIEECHHMYPKLRKILCLILEWDQKEQVRRISIWVVRVRRTLTLHQ